VDVTLLHRGPLFLRGFDDDVRRHLAAAMREDGIDLRFDVRVERVERGEEGLRLALSDGGSLDCEQALFATGRRPLTDELGLDAAGVERGPRGEIRVDRHSRTSAPGIWAIGDCTDRLALTPVAIHEAMCFARTVYEGVPTAPDYHDVPTAVFSEPPVGVVGLTETEARARHGAVDVYHDRFRPLLHTLSGRELQMLVKVVVARESDRVLGCHLVGPDAPEIVQGFAAAIRCGARKADLDATVGIHPTSAEELFSLREPAEPVPGEADA
jgi:glutathione reductase (NADPH)